jgi:hypothetical protein
VVPWYICKNCSCSSAVNLCKDARNESTVAAAALGPYRSAIISSIVGNARRCLAGAATGCRLAGLKRPITSTARHNTRMIDRQGKQDLAHTNAPLVPVPGTGAAGGCLHARCFVHDIKKRRVGKCSQFSFQIYYRPRQ